MERFHYSEPFFVERVEAAQKEARSLLNDLPKTEEDLFSHYRLLLSIHYNLLFFDPRWDHYTLDELALEWFLVHERNKSKETQTAETLATEYKDDLNAIADEMEFGPAQKMPALNPEELEKMNKFMESGKFPGET